MHRFLEAFFSPHAFRQVFPDVWNGFQTNIRMMVVAELLVLDVPIVASQKKTKPSAYGPVAGQIVTREQYGAVLQKGSKLKPFVDRAIRSLAANGTLVKLQKKWFNLNFSKVPLLK